ncbi:MAG: PQQ-binding-like beta-propeller repeat protein [Tepidisphaeraceae bacterium]|jgi:outer membrane protein assembly factor BamB/TolA-binding protein
MFGRLNSAARWIGFAVVIGPAIFAAGDDSPQPADLLYGKDNTAGVYVRDSAVALEKLALAQRMAGLGEWGKSADIYQEILEKYPDRVVPAGWDEQDRVVQYMSVTEAVRQALCKWPPEGLDVYRSRYETEAANLLGAAGGDAAKLHQVLSLYFPTDSGREAGLRLMDSYFESGEYAAVGQIGRRLLKWHPNLTAQRPMVIYRVGLADRLYGDEEDAQRQLDEMRRLWPQATGTIGGKDVILADDLTRRFAEARVREGTSGDSWLTVGGDPTRNRVSTSTVKPGARLYSIALPDRSIKTIDPAVRRQLEQQDLPQQQMGVRLGVMPVVDHGELFFQDNASLYAIDLDDGTPLPQWAANWPGGQFKLQGNVLPLPAGEQLCVTLTDKYVAAVMGMPDRLSGNPDASQSDTRLVCLDRASGRLLWTVSAEQLPEDQGALRSAQLNSAPLIVGDNIYVIAEGGRGQQFEECHVLCFGVSDGKFRWASYIASASGDSAGISPDGMIVVSDVVSHLAYAGGRLFVITNLGAAAALDAYSGSVIWLNIYRDQNVPPPVTPPFGAIIQDRLGVPVMSAPWKYNPAVVQNGKVFVFPSDGKYVFIYDAGSGAEIKRIWLSDLPDSSDTDKPDTLLAVRGDVMYLAGADRAWEVPWEAYDHDKNPSPDGGWATVDFGEPLRGRGFVTADALYLSTDTALRRILLKNGMIDPHQGTFPKNNFDPDEEGSGNVVVAEDHVIVAGDRQVAVYTDVALARQRLDQQVAAAPGDPAPRLHYAEVMFASGQTDVALEKLQDAFSILGAGDSASRDRGFSDAMNFAARLITRSGDPGQIARLFDLANVAAQSPLERAQYRMARAQFELTQNGVAAALGLYQEILSDPALAGISLAGGSEDSGSPARLVVRDAIAKVLQTPEGQAAYEPFEQAAAAALARAQGAGEATKMQEVADVYPNSRCAAEAMRAAAAAYEIGGDFHSAATEVRRLLNRYPDQPRAVLLEEMARDYLKIPGELGTAQRRLALAAAAAPGEKLSAPLTLADGTVVADVTLAAASDALNRMAPPAADLPDLHLPTSEQRLAYRRETGRWLVDPFGDPMSVAGVQAMAAPMEGFARNDRLIGWSQKSGLMVFPTSGGGAICNCADVNQPPSGVAWVNAGLLAWCGDVVYLIDPGTGRTIWCVDLDGAPPPHLDGDGAGLPPEQIGQVCPRQGRLILATNIGRLAAINYSDGKIAWQERPVGHELDRVLATDDFAVVRCQVDQDVRLMVFDAFNGEVLGEKSFAGDANEQPVNMAIADDGTLVYTLPDRLCVQDLFDAGARPDGMEPKFTTSPSPDSAPIFLGAVQDEQLIVRFGRAIAVSDQGKFVRIYDLATGRPWTFHSPDGSDQTDLHLGTDSYGSPNVTLSMAGRYLYVLSAQNLKAYQIDHPWLNWSAPAPARGMRSLEGILFGRDYLIAVDRQRPPLTVSNQSGSRVILEAYSRARVRSDPEKESGLGPYPRGVTENDDITALQAYEGGVAYFAGDAIHLLPGRRDHITVGAGAN